MPRFIEPARSLDHELRQHRRVVDDRASLGDSGKRGFERSVDARVVVQTQMDAIGTPRRFGRIGDEEGAVLFERLRFFGRSVPDPNGDAAAEHRANHGGAEPPRSVECDRFHLFTLPAGARGG